MPTDAKKGDDGLRTLPIRLAIRQEGGVVNAYLAKCDTMAGAHLVCSVAIGPVSRRPELWAQFRAFAERCVAEAIEDVFGVAPAAMVEQPAPEHERAENQRDTDEPLN